MVPGDMILVKAVQENVDIIGLSGLIPPSLDEIVYFVQTLKTRGMNVPFAIGGATIPPLMISARTL